MGIDILIPVLGRPEHAAPLAESLRHTRSEHRVFFICSPTDLETIPAYAEHGEILMAQWAPGKADFARKINWAFDQTDSEWVFQGATDIRFSDRWDVQALACAGRNRKRVIGTNDLHNVSVKRGAHSTHTLFARSYIEEYGGTTDGTGRVFSEVYDHQFCDVEFIDTARARKEFISCKNSIVEHLHPHWGNAVSDPIYKKALRNTNADRRLYMRRMGLEIRPRQRRRA